MIIRPFSPKVFVCTDHDGHYLVDTASVIIAENIEEATELLAEELRDRGLDSEDFTLREIDLDEKKAYVLCDGDF